MRVSNIVNIWIAERENRGVQIVVIKCEQQFWLVENRETNHENCIRTENKHPFLQQKNLPKILLRFARFRKVNIKLNKV